MLATSKQLCRLQQNDNQRAYLRPPITAHSLHSDAIVSLEEDQLSLQNSYDPKRADDDLSLANWLATSFFSFDRTTIWHPP